MSTKLASANRYLRDPDVREKTVTRSVATSSAIEGIVHLSGAVREWPEAARALSFRGSLSHRSQRPCCDCAENLDHRRVVAAQCRMNGRNVVPQGYLPEFTIRLRN